MILAHQLSVTQTRRENSKSKAFFIHVKKGSVSGLKTGVHKRPGGLCPQQEKLRADWAQGEATSAAHNSEIEGGDPHVPPPFHVRAPASDLPAVA